MNRSHDFISLYNKVADYLSQKTGESCRIPFYKLIEYAAKNDPVVAKHENRLKAYGDLRNTIVHYKGFPQEIIAEPSAGALADFKRVVDYIISPPKLIPTFEKTLRFFSSEDMLPDALGYMKENDFSQVIVKNGDAILLLTKEGIAKWLTHQIKEDIICISETTLKEILVNEIPNSYIIMDANKTIDHARAAFEKSLELKKARLYCIIITNDGKSTGKLMGIVTPWDIIERNQP